MEKKGIENINIEKNKELFEYEMTEVILKLKGEFAMFSGEGTKYQDSKVDDEDLRLELHPLNSVSMETYRGEVPTIKSIGTVNICQVNLERERTDIPIPLIHTIDIPSNSLKIKSKKNDGVCINVPKSTYELSPIDFSVARNEVTISIPVVPGLQEIKKVAISDVKQDTVKVIIPSVHVTLTKVCDDTHLNNVVKNVKSFFDTEILDLPKISSVALPDVLQKEIKVEVPSAQIIDCIASGNIIGKDSLNTEDVYFTSTLPDVPKINSQKLPNVNSVAIRVKVPTVNKIDPFAVNKKRNISVPKVIKTDVPTIKIKKIQPVCVSSKKIKIPNIRLNINVEKQFTADKVVIPQAVKVPTVHLKTLSTVNTTTQKKKDIQIPHLSPNAFRVESVIVECSASIKIPSAPDVRADIERIISLATG